MDQPAFDNQCDFEVPQPRLLLDQDGEKLAARPRPRARPCTGWRQEEAR
ncbi:MAG: hypothetical protein MUF34_14200 [Polyangiaceae bacterium]|nr:hypothetical protein [Polyangiaceae bacterium]